MTRRSQELKNWAFALARGAVQRALTPGEQAMVPPGLSTELDLSAIRIIDRAHNPFALGKVLVRGADIYWPGAPADISRAGLAVRALFVHELCHVWQYRTGRLSAPRYLLNPANWEYRYEVREGAEFDGYGTEKQADLVQDWYRMRQGAQPRHFRSGHAPTLDWLEGVIPFARPQSPGV